MREEVIASQAQDWREVVKALLGPVPDGKAIYLVEEKEVPAESLTSEFARRASKDGRTKLLLRYDNEVTHGEVVKVQYVEHVPPHVAAANGCKNAAAG